MKLHCLYPLFASVMYKESVTFSHHLKAILKIYIRDFEVSDNASVSLLALHVWLVLRRKLGCGWGLTRAMLQNKFYSSTIYPKIVFFFFFDQYTCPLTWYWSIVNLFKKWAISNGQDILYTFNEIDKKVLICLFFTKKYLNVSFYCKWV